MLTSNVYFGFSNVTSNISLDTTFKITNCFFLNQKYLKLLGRIFLLVILFLQVPYQFKMKSIILLLKTIYMIDNCLFDFRIEIILSALYMQLIKYNIIYITVLL